VGGTPMTENKQTNKIKTHRNDNDFILAKTFKSKFLPRVQNKAKKKKRLKIKI